MGGGYKTEGRGEEVQNWREGGGQKLMERGTKLKEMGTKLKGGERVQN